MFELPDPSSRVDRILEIVLQNVGRKAAPV
jgi:hypothetical protein